MIVKFPALAQVAPRFTWPVYTAQNLGQWIEKTLVIAWEMTFNRWKDRGDDVVRAAMFRKENLDAGAGRFGRLNEDKLVLVGNDHHDIGGIIERVELSGSSIVLAELRQ
jgi:hypothetical protein